MSANRHDPLDADERALARVLRALPAGEPPSALDARLLAMARDAVVTTPAQADEAQPRARRAPRWAWGLGVAASCVMAAGLVWRLGGFGSDAVDSAGVPIPAEATTASALQPAPPMPEAEPESISVEISPPRAAAPAIMPPPPAPPAPAASAMNRQADAQRARLRELSQEAQREREVDGPSAPEPASATPLAEAAMAAPAGAADASVALDSVRVTGSRVASVEHEDSGAGPQAWLQRIRARLQRGDEDGARDSLRAFVERYPDKPLPQDLIDFRARVEAPAADPTEPDAG